MNDERSFWNVTWVLIAVLAALDFALALMYVVDRQWILAAINFAVMIWLVVLVVVAAKRKGR